MASVPAETNSTSPDNDMLMGFNRLNLLRQLGLMIGLAASVALGLAVVLWSQEPNFQPLMSKINMVDIEEATRILNQDNIKFKVDPNTGVLLVESGQVFSARMKLAAAGITSDKSVGYELMDKNQGLGTSQFVEATQFKRGLEGELSRTISSFRNIQSARVHLAIPKRSVFVRDSRKPSASVLLESFSGASITREQVSAIVNLVAGSVPEMIAKNVTVVDQKGNLLSRNDESAEDRLVSKQFEYTRKLESVLNNRILAILEPIIGAGRFRSEVSADLDFTAIEETDETYNPDTKIIRSEQTLDEQRQAGADGGVPGALSNQPPAAASAPENAAGANGQGAAGSSNNLRKQTTRNYEVDRTLSYTKHQKGRVKRLTVAVAVDDIRNINKETGEVTFTPWTDKELERLTILVRNAVGYSASRGDSVSVINTPFAPEVVEPPPVAPKFWETSWFWDLMKQVMAGLVILILILGLVRPALKNLASSGANAKELALAGDEDGLAQLDQLGEGSAEDKVTLTAADEFLLPGASEGYDKQINALKGLVAEDPARVAQVIRQWVNADD